MSKDDNRNGQDYVGMISYKYEQKTGSDISDIYKAWKGCSVCSAMAELLHRCELGFFFCVCRRESSCMLQVFAVQFSSGSGVPSLCSNRWPLRVQRLQQCGLLSSLECGCETQP